MGNKDDKDSRGLGEIIGDIEKHIDDVERGGQSSSKQPVSSPKPPVSPKQPSAQKPERKAPASQPSSGSTTQERKEIDEATLEQLAKVREAYNRQDPLVRRAQKRTRLALLSGALLIIVILGLVYFFSLNRIEAPSLDDFNPNDLSAPADSRTGDQFEEERKRLKAAMPKVSAGKPEGLTELHSIAKDYPKSPQAAKALGVLAVTYRYQKQNHTEALKAYQQLLDDFPDDRNVDRTRKAYIEYLIELGRKKEAIEQSEILLEEAKAPRDKNIAKSFLKQLQ